MDDWMPPEEFLECELRQLTATPPLGVITRAVWKTNELVEILADVGDQHSPYIDFELSKWNIHVDGRTLSALVEIVATAMISTSSPRQSRI